jgi:Carboxypeptidase regulatory-like domain
MSAPVEIEVGSANLEHLELRMVPPFEMAGQVRYDDDQARQPPLPLPGHTPPPPRPRMARLIALDEIYIGVDSELSGPIRADDSFTLGRIQPGRYRVNITGGWGYVKSVRVGDTESEGDILDLRNGPAGPLTVTVSSNFCEVTGTVRDSKGPVADTPVVLRSEGDWPNIQDARTDSNGTYKFASVSPGKYRLMAVDEDTLPLGDVGQDFEDSGEVAVSVNLSPGDKVTQDLMRRK